MERFKDRNASLKIAQSHSRGGITCLDTLGKYMGANVMKALRQSGRHKEGSSKKELFRTIALS
jgi:hypothetical protein